MYSKNTLGRPHAKSQSDPCFLDDPGDEELPSALQAVRRSERDWLDVVLAIAGEPEAGRRYLHDRRLTEFPGVLSVELAPVFRVTHPRSAALIDADGLLRSLGIVVSRTDLEGLVRPPGRSSAARRG